MLFSEPKIPQFIAQEAMARTISSFSALQRAENSSIQVSGRCNPYRWWFQCSSASRKFLNSEKWQVVVPISGCFSALQRAENSSMEYVDNFIKLLYEFQCSSASRKFLNKYYVDRRHCMHISFSALQRAENSSILKQGNVHQRKHCGFSALQRAENSSMCTAKSAQ